MLRLRHNESLESFDTQKLAILAIIFGSFLSYVVLTGTEEQQKGTFPCKDYSYLHQLPKISAIIFVVVTAYFLYLTYLQYQEEPQNKTVMLLLVISALGAAAALLREYVTLTSDTTNVDVIAEEAVLDF